MIDIDTLPISDTEHRRIITELTERYKPVKTRETDIRMTIILKDDEPVYQKARRISQAEKDIVNAEIDECSRKV